jgi:hypothetical protein
VSNSLIRALRGPMVMITLGSMLALDHFTEYRFWKTWPVLLIVLGAMKLLERIFATPAQFPQQPGGMPGGTIGGQ